MASIWDGGRMSSSIAGKLLLREYGIDRKPTSVRSIYGDKSWISTLDIVNELAGHQGCVNALSWSKSGLLLASGSDDTNLLIHKYQPSESTKPFSLATCISTGHRANIFSVKFMPHSSDRILISCAGDHEVRVFDLEYSGGSVEASNASSITGARSQAGRRNIAGLYQGVSYLSDGSTNAKVYRSHSDRVKRIVTESSPNLFLTCSEDGEVRQFDLRLPSSAYPRQSNASTVIFNAGSQATGHAPPPLISYKKYQLDLNSISCSASQPHYILLGGAHLHCFLHDRRMLGRDLTEERGSKGDSDMGTATRCVRRFAPNGKTVMSPKDPGHVTACKISDKNPNEMIASWSGDRIYGFNLIRADEVESPSNAVSRKSKESRDRKRKRSAHARREEDVVIRMRYENGQIEDFPVTQSVSQRFANQARESLLTDTQKQSAHIGKSIVKVRKLLFSMDHGSELTTLKPVLSEILGISSSCLQQMDDIMRTWSYPIDPNPSVLTFQRTLRMHRDSARRFVQACGTLAGVLGGSIHTTRPSPLLDLFTTIHASSLEHSERRSEVIFRYDFLKAILLWLEGGKSKLTAGFPIQASSLTTRQPPSTLNSEEREMTQICEALLNRAAVIPPRPIVNVENSRFETNDRRVVFKKEFDAVKAFAEVIRIPFSQGEPVASHAAQNRDAAMKYWGLKVCRGLLMNAGDGVDFASVDRAFGGLGSQLEPAERSQEDIDSEAEDLVVSSAQVVPTIDNGQESNHSDDDNSDEHEGALMDIDDVLDELDNLEGEEMVFDDNGEAQDESDEHDEDGPYDDNEEAEDSDGNEEDNDENEDIFESGIFFRGSATRSTLRAQVNKDLPCNSHIRTYQGHCNVKTVKDVNFFGLDDEYVVSGCDSGHLFIWDRKTSKLLNILKGDCEVVNVVQGHPYEPTIAVAGIDHTIKIFSPDIRAQHEARKAINLGMKLNGSSGTSSLRPALRYAAIQTDQEPTNPSIELDDELSDNEPAPGGLSSKKRMHASYNIISQNEVDRAGGNREAFITRDMLSQLAVMMARRRQRGQATTAADGADGNDDDDEENETGTVGAALEDRCANM